MSPLSTAAAPARGASTVTGTPAATSRRCPAAARTERREPLPAHSTGALVVEIDRHGLQPLIQVSGELDLASVPLLRAMIDHVRHSAGSLDAHLPERIEVDLRRVTFADSHGLAPILEGEAAVRNASPAVRRVLQLLQHQPSTRTPAVARGCSGSPAGTLRLAGATKAGATTAGATITPLHRTPAAVHDQRHGGHRA